LEATNIKECQTSSVACWLPRLPMNLKSCTFLWQYWG